ncbi:upstream-binding factor 1-like protein 1 [Lampris incognitus]|uniref:upstream-binding factor 1-like protein 1 n=1 Tax=Lampris incognitus TaxID=2546036 RepID=UPI0024B59734|nr:upstream-binding factor 1-like protein 1 [Lampris incognitus]
MEAEEPVWTKYDLERLLHAMKQNLPGSFRRSPYSKGQSSVDWRKVAFGPFSSEECWKKWLQISQKISKIRSLPELIGHAEGAIANPFRGTNCEIYPDFPKKPYPSNKIFMLENLEKLKRKNPRLSRQKLRTLANYEYYKLPKHKKAKYVNKFLVADGEYQERLQQLRKQFRPGAHLQKRCLAPTPKTPVTPRKLERAVPPTGPNQQDQHVKCKTDTSTEEETLSSCSDTGPLTSGGGMPVKPPLNGFVIFSKKLRSSKSCSGKVSTTVCAQRWRQLTNQQRDKYNGLCLKLREEYAVKLKEYLSSLPEEEQQKMHSLKAVPQLRKSCSGPKMPSLLGSALYYREKIELLRERFPNAKERLAEATQMWANLSAAEKSVYYQASRKNFQKFILDQQQYFDALTAEEQARYVKENQRKSRYLKLQKKKDCLKKEERPHRTSDSEDEDILDISSNEEKYSDSAEEQESEEFEMTFWGMR